MLRLFHALKDRGHAAFSVVSQYRWAIHALLVFLALTLGFWGWMLFDPGKGVLGVLNNIFRTVQLIALQFPTDFRDVPWQLQVARLLVPLFAVVASFHVIIGSITRPVRVGLLPFARNHIFIYGPEALTDAALAAVVSRGRRVVIVAATVDSARLSALEGLGVTVVDSDPLQPQTFKSLALKNSAAVFLVADDDVSNLNVAMLVLSAAGGRPDDLPPLILAVRIQREDLATELDAALDGLARSQRVQYHRLIPGRESLRLELPQFAPIWTKRDLAERSHVLLLGLTGRWQQIASQIIVATQDHPTERPLLTFVVSADTEADTLQRWRAARPEFDLVVEIDVLVRNASDLLPSDDAVTKWRAARPVPHLAIVMREDADAISTMLALRRPGNALGTETVPMLVHQSKEDRILYRLGETKITERDMTRLVAFGGLIRAESIDRVLDRTGDEVAIRLHAHYLDAAKTLFPGSPAALATWDGLTENLRDANRVVAHHAPILLAAAGLKIVRSGDRIEVATVTADELERLAMIEHRRWMADRIDHGWRRGPVRDDRLMLHTDFVPWDELSESDKEKDRSSVRSLIASLAEVGRVLVRQPRP
jgi:hypothetical protein